MTGGPWDARTKQIRDLQGCHEEFDTTLCELAARTDDVTAFRALALTVSTRAHMTASPQTALRDFKRMLTETFMAVAKNIEDGIWTPPKSRP